MEPDRSAAVSFGTTMWSLIVNARADRGDLERLLRSYWAPVYAFIRRCGYNRHDSSDLTQEFLATVVLGRDLISKADPTRGRFRSFLKQALRNFLIDQHRLNKHHKSGSGGGAGGGGGRPMNVGPPDAELTADTRESGVQAAAKAFDRQWAVSVVQQAVDRLEESLRLDGMVAHWHAFDANVVGPTLRRTAAIPLEVLAPRIGAADASQASNMVQTAKRRFRRVLRDVVAETVQNAEEVERELDELRGLIR